MERGLIIEPESGSAIRTVDELGRIVIPPDYRQWAGWAPRQPVEICKSPDDGVLLLKKAPAIQQLGFCRLCGCRDKTQLYPVTPDYSLCTGCITLIQDVVMTEPEG